MPTPRLAAAALLFLLTLAGCGTAPTVSPSVAPTQEPPPSDAVSVEEALGMSGAGPILVAGNLVATPDGQIRLCAVLLESLPPQCGGASLLVPGLDLRTIPGLESVNGVTWGFVELVGVVDGDVFSVAIVESQGQGRGMLPAA